jgi:hypothetical protein
VSTPKSCFFNKERPCDLTCKAAFEVDDPVDNVDCYFIWLAHHFGESLFSLRGVMEGMGGAPFGGMTPGGPSPGAGPPTGEGPSPGPGPKGPKGFPNN